jgi:uncharacterized protein
MPESREAIKVRFQEALDLFTNKVKQDGYIIAAILGGSMSHDTVWEKSDLDILLVGRSEKVPERYYNLIENGVNIHASLLSRSKFKQQIERALQSSFFHSYFSKSRLLFSTDETISEYYQNVQHLGARDRQLQLLRAASDVLPVLAKAEKWLYVKNDPSYSFLWLMYMINELASIEVIAAGEVTSREVIHQALKHNPAFFQAIYFDMITQPVDHAAVERALRLINSYLNERITMLFQPFLDYLSAADGPRSASDIDSYFRKQLQNETIGTVYEWLADQGVIHKVSHPLRLTEKSRVTVDEAAYYYDGESDPRRHTKEHE